MQLRRARTCTDEIKHFVGAIKRRFLTLVELAKKDDAMAENIALFFCETFYNINKHLSEAAAKLPAGREGKPHITVTYKFGLLDELEEDCDEDDPDPTARFAFPSRKRSRSQLAGERPASWRRSGFITRRRGSACAERDRNPHSPLVTWTGVWPLR